MAQTLTGLDRILQSGLALPGRGRIGLLCNATTVTAGWQPTAESFTRLAHVRVERIFSPQHGFAAEKQDNMIASSDRRHPGLGIPVTSLYGERREPAPGAFAGLDALVVDLPDVGTRVYTFLVTAVLAMRAAWRENLPVIVIDRPNPIGGAIEGPVLEAAWSSFVGILDVPLRHGLTPAEFCLYGARCLGLLEERSAEQLAEAARALLAEGERTAAPLAEDPGGRLGIVPLAGWHRGRYQDETALPWTMPSPNMPTLETALVYPGQVILEGTNLSEGRGTTRPFELWGAPFLDPAAVLAELGRRGWTPGADGVGRPATPLAGVRLRPIDFEPTFQKHAGEAVHGFQLHVLDRRAFQPVAATTALLAVTRDLYPQAFAWRKPPYEYEVERLPIDLIYGTDRVRRDLEAGVAPEALCASWEPELAAYRERIRPLQIYPSAPPGAEGGGSG